MRFVVLWVALLGLPYLTLQANLGSTPDETQEKYGRAQGELPPSKGTDKATQYGDSNRLYNVHFKDEKAVLIQIAGRRRPLNYGDVFRLLRNHNNGDNWERDPLMDDRWQTKDGRATAEFDARKGTLFIIDTDWQRRQTAPPKPGSEGQPAEKISSDNNTAAPDDAEKVGDEVNKGGTVIRRGDQ